MNLRTFLLVLGCSLLPAWSASAQKAHTPAAGTEERQAIMDGLREPVEKDLKQRVIFKVDRLRVAGNWAYARVSPLRPDGSAINFRQTRYRVAMEEGMFDPQGEALLKYDGTGWKVLEWVFGSTDVPSVDWPDTYRLPKSLLE